MKKLSNLFLITALLFGVQACKEEATINPTYNISFDDISGYTKDPSIINNTVSHSGLNCVQINKDMIYGSTFSKKLGSISATPINLVKMKVWVRLSSSDGYVKIVCSVENDSSKSFYWNALDSKSFNLKNGEWTEINGEFNIKAHNNPNHLLKIYPLHQEGEMILIDDLELSFE
ncbi:MAG: hypothetical protein IPK10_06990 [Bacteroidetes bacterium]|nr:hypothetical protein [Bacteroidota bacterium]